MLGIFGLLVISSVSLTMSTRLFIDPKTTLGCHRREYTFRATHTDAQGRRCWDHLTTMSCWGRCDSGEIADWRFPYKRSFHPVCIHDKRQKKRVTLRYCDPGVKDEIREYQFLEAATCTCKLCDSSSNSCQGTPYENPTMATNDV